MSAVIPHGPGTTAAAPVTTAATRCWARLTDEPLDVAHHVRLAGCAAAGAVATFVGQVRDHDPDVDGAVVGIEYSAHPDAPEALARIAQRWAAEPEVLGVAVSHRVGHLDVGDVAIVVAIATAHRRRAFEVCADLVEQVKAELPVWKRELLAGGGHVWVGSA